MHVCGRAGIIPVVLVKVGSACRKTRSSMGLVCAASLLKRPVWGCQLHVIWHAGFERYMPATLIMTLVCMVCGCACHDSHMFLRPLYALSMHLTIYAGAAAVRGIKQHAATSAGVQARLHLSCCAAAGRAGPI